MNAQMNLNTDILEFLHEVYVPLRLRGRSPNSVRLLAHAVRQFSRWLERPARLADLSDLTVSRYLMARAKKLSPHSVARERSGLVAIWNLAHHRGLIKYAPCLPPELCPSKIPRAFTSSELIRLNTAASLSYGYAGRVPASVFFQALLSVAFETGERISALLSIPRACWSSPHLTVPAFIRKGGKTERVYQLSPETAELLDDAAANGSDRVLYWPSSDNALRKRWKTITRRAGVGDGPDVQFHALRRSTASHLAAAGGDATAYLGHSTDRVTRKSYLDPRITEANKPPAWQILPRLRAPR